MVSEFRLATEEIPTGEFMVRILVDGEPFGKDCVDLIELWSSGSTSGGHDILTCGCGVPECAGFYDPIFVSHDGSNVTWEFDPKFYLIAEKGNTIPTVEGRLVFDRREYVLELRGLFTSLESDPRRGRLGPYGFDFQFLSDPSPRIDELRTPFPAGSSVSVAYSRDFRQPVITVDCDERVRMKRLVPTMAANSAFEKWRSMWLEEWGDADRGTPDSALYQMKPEFSLVDCNSASRATAESLKSYWKDAAEIRWQRIDSISPWRTESESTR